MEWLPLLLSGVSSLASGIMGQNAATQSTKAMTDALQKAMKYDQKTLRKVLGMNRDTIGKVLGVNRDATDASLGDINSAVARSLGLTDAGLERAISTQNAGVDRSIGITDAATKRALGIQDSATERSVGALRDAENRGRADLAPWMQAGSQALEAYSGELGLTQPNGQPYVSKFRETAGYQFKKAEGEKSVVNNMRAMGMGASGAAMKALNKYGQGIADQEHDQYIDRLGGLSAAGQNAASTAAGLSAQIGGNIAGTVMQGAGNNIGTVLNGANQNSNAVMTGAGNNAGYITNAAGQNVGTILNGASALAGIRQGGAANAGNALMTGNSNAIDAILNRRGNISDNLINMGTAQGTGAVAGMNSWTDALRGFTNTLGRTLGSTSNSWGSILGGGKYAGGVTY